MTAAATELYWQIMSSFQQVVRALDLFTRLLLTLIDDMFTSAPLTQLSLSKGWYIVMAGIATSGNYVLLIFREITFKNRNGLLLRFNILIFRVTMFKKNEEIKSFRND